MSQDTKTREVERYLYRVVDSASQSEGVKSASHYVVCNLRLNIHEVGSWIIKFLPSGEVLLNNCEIIMTANTIEVDASISFVSVDNFWATINGHIHFEQAACHINGTEDTIKWFKQNIFMTSVGGTFAENPNGLSTKSQARELFTQQKQLDMNANELIRQGWLLKKRDIMNGWKSRYFKVYIGRFEYFVNPNDDVPRAVIPLLGAKVGVPREMRNRVKNRGVFHQIVITPKYFEKSFKLISRSQGEEGLREILAWARAFEIACEPAVRATKLLKDAVDREEQIITDGIDKPNILGGNGNISPSSFTSNIRRSISGTFSADITGTLDAVGTTGSSSKSPMMLSVVILFVSIFIRLSMYYGGITLAWTVDVGISLTLLLLLAFGYRALMRLYSEGHDNDELGSTTSSFEETPHDDS